MSETTTRPATKPKIEEDHVAIGARIKSLRTSRNITQVALGESLGVSFQQIQKYESGKNRVSYAMLKRMAVVFDCPLSDLAEDTNDEAIASLFDPRVSSLASRLNAMDPERRGKTIKALNNVITAMESAAGSGDAVPPAP